MNYGNDDEIKKELLLIRESWSDGSKPIPWGLIFWSLGQMLLKCNDSMVSFVEASLREATMRQSWDYVTGRLASLES